MTKLLTVTRPLRIITADLRPRQWPAIRLRLQLRRRDALLARRRSVPLALPQPLRRSRSRSRQTTGGRLRRSQHGHGLQARRGAAQGVRQDQTLAEDGEMETHGRGRTRQDRGVESRGDAAGACVWRLQQQVRGHGAVSGARVPASGQGDEVAVG